MGAGAAAAIAHPPFGILPGLLGYALLLRLVDQADGDRPLRRAFWRGWLAGSAISQGASLIGAYGMTFVTLAVAAAPATLFDKAGLRSRLAVPVLAALALTVLAGWGSWRLRHAVAQSDVAPLVRIVQAN